MVDGYALSWSGFAWGLWLRGRYMTRESVISLEVVFTLVVYCPLSWGLAESALGWSVPLARQD